MCRFCSVADARLHGAGVVNRSLRVALLAGCLLPGLHAAWAGTPAGVDEYQPIEQRKGEVIDLNRATRADLERLPQVGVNKADLIIKAREVSAFASWDDFKRRVPGFQRKTLERMQAFGATIHPAAP
jgi:hypothetical protein